MAIKPIFDSAIKDKNGNLQFFSPSGEKERIKYIWNESGDALVEHERIDIVKEMNERAKGMSIAEQIARLDRGDTSVIDPSKVTDVDFSCDLSGMPESPIEIIQEKNDIQRKVMSMQSQAKEDEELKSLQEQLIAKKAEYDAAKEAVDDKMAASQVKDGE